MAPGNYFRYDFELYRSTPSSPSYTKVQNFAQILKSLKLLHLEHEPSEIWHLVILLLSLSLVKNGDCSQVPSGTSHTKDSFVAVHNKLLHHPVQKIMCTNYNQSFNLSSCRSCNHNLWQLLSCCWLVGWLVHCTSNLGDSSAFKCLFNVFGIIQMRNLSSFVL